MAILPLSKQGEALRQAAHQRLARDWQWLQQRINVQLVLPFDGDDSQLAQEDWRDLAGFAFAHRPLEAGLGALQRLLRISRLPLPALRLHLQRQQTPARCIIQLGLSGQKTLLRHLRYEVAEALTQLDAQHCHQWRAWTIRCC